MQQILLRLVHALIDSERFTPTRDSNGMIKTTYCNIALDVLAHTIWNYTDFKGFLANQIAEALQTSVNWKSISYERAHTETAKGNLVVAAQVNSKGHGHVALILPGPMQYSNKWKIFVPQCFHVGETVAIVGLNWAFEKEPTVYLYEPTIS